MSGETTAGLVEQVRSRYAEAARAVLNPRGEPGCGCGPSCCGGPHATGPAALETADCFGGSRYGEGETDGLPAEAVLASLGCGQVSGSWTWVRAAVSMCCCQRAGSARPGSLTGG